jgi:large subunit ribosomal protein L9
MEVILLESVRKLGIAGSKVKVKDGFGRNYLIPLSKAVRATKENVALFDAKRAIIDSENAKNLEEAKQRAQNLDNLSVEIVRQSAEDGRLFGSVGAKDVVTAIKEKVETTIERSNVILSRPIKSIGIHDVIVSLHPDVNITIKVNVVSTESNISLKH